MGPKGRIFNLETLFLYGGMKKEGNQNCSIKGILKKITGIVLNLGCTAIWRSFLKLRGDKTHPESKGKNRKREKAEANSYCIVLELTELSSTQFRSFSGNIKEAVWSIALVSGGYIRDISLIFHSISCSRAPSSKARLPAFESQLRHWKTLGKLFNFS